MNSEGIPAYFREMKALSMFQGISLQGVHGHGWKAFFSELQAEFEKDQVYNGAAALAFYLLLAIFPALIFLLNLLPYLPTQDLQLELLNGLNQTLPAETVEAIMSPIRDVVNNKRQGLLSIGAILTLWSASSGMHAMIDALNHTHDTKESRSYWKARLVAIALTFTAGILLICSFLIIVLGELTQTWLSENISWTAPFLFVFGTLRVIVPLLAILLAFAIVYAFGPDKRRDFKLITPGSLVATLLIIATSLLFKLSVENFGNFNATYGSLGAIIVLMLWLQILGLVILLGSEIDVLIERWGLSISKS